MDVSYLYLLLLIPVILTLFIIIKSIQINKHKNMKQNIPNIKQNEKSYSKESDIITPYYLKQSILTNTEQKLYNQLKIYIPDQYTICPKVGIKDFIGIKNTSNYMSYFGKISQKHIDFLICDKLTLNPCLGIELDDYTHQSIKQQERDAFINQLYNDTGLTILHIYDIRKTEQLKENIKNILGEKTNIIENNTKHQENTTQIS